MCCPHLRQNVRYTLANFEPCSKYISCRNRTEKQTVSRNFVIYYISQTEINKFRNISPTEANNYN